MDAIRVARGVTGRTRIVKVEGGYHGHHDAVLVSIKPPAGGAGPADAPRRVAATGGHCRQASSTRPRSCPSTIRGARRALAPRDVACFIVEPVMENIGICLPDPGYLDAVREITRIRHAAALRRGQDRHHGGLARRRRSDTG